MWNCQLCQKEFEDVKPRTEIYLITQEELNHASET